MTTSNTGDTIANDKLRKIVQDIADDVFNGWPLNPENRIVEIRQVLGQRTEHNSSDSKPREVQSSMPEILKDFAEAGQIEPYFDEILALFATFLASIELPEKYDPQEGSGLEYDIGFNVAVDPSQAIIDKIVEELRHGAN